MKPVLHRLALTAVCVAFSASALAAPAPCVIKGKFTDSLGSTGSFKNQTMGTVKNTNICPSAYALTVTKLTNKVINFKGVPGSSSCGALTGKLKFQNNACLVAEGPITIKGLGTVDDTVTRASKSGSRVQPDNSALTSGLK